MESLFLRLLNMSLTGALVIAVVALLRLPLRSAPKKWRYLLWVAPAFRLACPVSFRAFFSIFRLKPPAAPSAIDTAVGAAELTYIRRTASPIFPASPRPIPVTSAPAPAVTAMPAAPVTAAPVEAAAAADPAQLWLHIAMALWLAGLAVMLIMGVVRYFRMRGRLADAAKLEAGVFASDAIRVPFILGLLPPRVYVPAGLAGKELSYVLAHERAHLRRFDHWVKLLAYLLLSLHWFNPLVWLAFYLMSRDMEMSCDERVLSGMAGEAKDYSRTLLAFAVGRRFPAPAPLAFGESDVKTRIKNALRWRKPRLWVTILAVVLCLAAIAACTANPKEKTEPPAPGVDLMASDIHEARLLNSSRDQVYGLNKDQRDELIRLLSAVPADKIVQGRGIPSEKVLEMMGAEYSLRFAGGIVELDFDDPAAAAKKYGPAVWEIRDEALYDWLEALWAENSAVLEKAEEPEPHFAIPDIAARTEDDTVAFGFEEGRLAFLGVEGKTNQDVIDVVPFDNLRFRAEDNFLSPGDPSILSGGTLRAGMSAAETRQALFGDAHHTGIGEQQMRKPQIVLHPDVGAEDYPITGVYAGQLFDLSLLYGSGGEVLADVTLTFLPNEGEDHAVTLYALLRSALIQQLGPPQKEELDGHYDRHETSYDKDGNAVNSSEPVDYVMAVWGDGEATLTLRLEIGQYYSRSLTIDFYENIYYVEETGTPADGLSKMAALTAQDITGVFSAGWVETDAETLAPLMSAAAAHPAAEPEVKSELKFEWWVEVYLTGGPDVFSSRDEHYYLCAQQTENLLYVRYWDGEHGDGGAEEFWLEDADLYDLVRGCFRSDGIVEADAWEKYGVYLEIRAQETIDHYAPYGTGGLVGFDVTRLEKTAYSWRSEEGEYLPVYAWQVAFYPEDVTNVGWAGGMKLDADNRVIGIENDTYFAVREGAGGPELTFLPYDTYFRWEGGLYDNWREAYRSLFENVLLKETEYTGTAGWPVTGVTLADLSGSGVPELIAFLPGASVSGAAVVVTFEEGEARAFNLENSLGLTPAKNAVDSSFWANQTVYNDDDAGFRSSGSGWYLNSRNAAWPAEAWCDWFRFGADRNGFLTCELLYSLSVQGEESFGGVYTETGWQLSGQTVSREEYYMALAEIEEWRRSLDDFPWTELSLPFREHGELLSPDELTERFDDLLVNWQTPY